MMLLSEVFDKKFMRTYKKKNASQWLKMVVEFERRKKACGKNNPGCTKDKKK